MHPLMMPVFLLLTLCPFDILIALQPYTHERNGLMSH